MNNQHKLYMVKENWGHVVVQLVEALCFKLEGCNQVPNTT